MTLHRIHTILDGLKVTNTVINMVAFLSISAWCYGRLRNPSNSEFKILTVLFTTASVAHCSVLGAWVLEAHREVAYTALVLAGIVNLAALFSWALNLLRR
jgi:hypothetical protein